MREEAKNTPQRLVFLFPPWKNPIKTSELLGKSARLLKAPEILQSQAFFPLKMRIWDEGVASSFPPASQRAASLGQWQEQGQAGSRIDGWMPGWSCWDAGIG